METIAAGNKTYDVLAPMQEAEKAAADKAQETVNSEDNLPQRSADNQQLAWNQLRRANRDAETIHWEEPGNTIVRAGLTVQLSGYGVADGVYLIDKCTHRIGSGGTGYVTSAEGHKRLVGYGGGSGGTGSAGGAGGGNNPQAPAVNPTGSSIPGATASRT